MGEQDRAAPFLKWVGGKGRLLPEIVSRMPSARRRYYEPFVGGGAVFFGLEGGPAVLGDVNVQLMETYSAIKDDVNAVIAALVRHREAYAGPARKGYYYDVRNQINDGGLVGAELAAAFIFLNKTCFNGLCRVNRAGKFNVPEGDYKNPTIFDEGNLRRVSARLYGVALMTASYEVSTATATEGDVVYMDPPYDPISKTSNFTAYASQGFGSDDQARLAAHAKMLVDVGATVILSNNDTPLIRRLYDGWTIDTVKCARPVNRRGDKRGEVNEVIITNKGTT